MFNIVLEFLLSSRVEKIKTEDGFFSLFSFHPVIYFTHQ